MKLQPTPTMPKWRAAAEARLAAPRSAPTRTLSAPMSRSSRLPLRRKPVRSSTRCFVSIPVIMCCVRAVTESCHLPPYSPLYRHLRERSALLGTKPRLRFLNLGASHMLEGFLKYAALTILMETIVFYSSKSPGVNSTTSTFCLVKFLNIIIPRLPRLSPVSRRWRQIMRERRLPIDNGQSMKMSEGESDRSMR